MACRRAGRSLVRSVGIRRRPEPRFAAQLRRGFRGLARGFRSAASERNRRGQTQQNQRRHLHLVSPQVAQVVPCFQYSRPTARFRVISQGVIRLTGTRQRRAVSTSHSCQVPPKSKLAASPTLLLSLRTLPTLTNSGRMAVVQRRLTSAGAPPAPASASRPPLSPASVFPKTILAFPNGTCSPEQLSGQSGRPGRVHWPVGVARKPSILIPNLQHRLKPGRTRPLATPSRSAMM